MAGEQLPNVMVAGAHSMGALGVIRSLGRAGYSVHAVSSQKSAIGLKSSYAQFATVHPDNDCPDFEQWFVKYVDENQIRMIVPGWPIAPGGHPLMDQYSHLFPVSTDCRVLGNGRKYELFDTLLNSSGAEKEHLPPMLLVDFSKDLPKLSELERLEFPLFLKLDGAHAKQRQGDQVIKLATPVRGVECLNQHKANYHKGIVQGYAKGIGVGVFLLRWNKKTIARFMHRRLHEMPHTGGASSLREAWWHEDIYQDAQSKLDYIDWQGVAMIEYRWDEETDEFHLMEMNLRFWGSVHLALFSGVDFPKLLADSFFHRSIPKPPAARIGLKCRNTIPFELGYLVSLWRDPSVPIGKKLFSVWEALWLSLDLRVKNDLLFPGDRKLFFIRLATFLKTGR